MQQQATIQQSSYLSITSTSEFEPERTCDHRRLARQVSVRAALCAGRGWDQCHAAVADATLGDNTIGEVLHVSA